jgi:ribosomal protein S18 acetylase RimI-like enzyme
MLLLMAETIGGEAVGHAWVELRRPSVGGDAWIFDIEVLENQRGKGFGRALLRATEREAAAHGVTTMGLNVFGANTVARGLYESSGYETVTLQMRKRLDG